MVCRVSNLTLGKKIGLLSVFQNTLGKKSGLPSVFQNTLGKKSGLPSVFPEYTQQTIILCRVFLGITLGKPIFQRKIIIFFSAYHYCLPSVFGITLGKPIFRRKKIIFLSIFQLHEATRCKIKKNGYVNNEINTKLGPNSSCESNAVTTNYSKIYNK